MIIGRISNFIDSELAARIIAECKPGVDGIEGKSTYSRGLQNSPDVVRLVTRPDVVELARDVLFLDEAPLRYMSLTAFTVEPGSAGMPSHVDYPHFHVSCPDDYPLCAQFVLSLDGTIGGAAPTWIGREDDVYELEPCELAVFDGRMMHGVKPNTSNRNRTNLLWSIGPIWVCPMQIGLWNMTVGEKTPQEVILGK
jgi:hypothetical protein